MLLQQTLNTRNYISIYMHLTGSHFLFPYCCGDIGGVGREAHNFVKEVTCPVEFNLATDDPFAHQYLVQCILVSVQRGNVAALLGCMGVRGGGLVVFSFVCLSFLSMHLNYIKVITLKVVLF